jgi:hypothetical protein
MKLKGRRRDIIMILAGAIAALALISPVGADVTNSVTHLWSDHIKAKVKALAYTRAQSDATLLDGTEVAVDSEELDGKDSTELALLAGPTRTLGDVGEPNFNQGDMGAVTTQFYSCYWDNFGSAGNPGGFYKDGHGIVHLRGLVKAIDGQTDTCGSNEGADKLIFQLPEGYRPAKKTVLATVAANQVGRINVRPDGWVEVESSFLGSAETSLSLEGLTFLGVN